MAYLLSFYEIDRAYGGPEEGGWYFDTGELVRTFRIARNEADAYKLASRANRKRSTSSVLYSGGRYCVEVHQHRAPSCYPEQRPYYE
jgi:hypothetical protein